MMTRTLGCVFVALVAVTYALPVVEDTWAPEDELLQRVFSDSTPMSLMQADPTTIADAKAKKEKAEGEMKAAEADEKKFTEEEAALTTKAAALKAASEELKDKATKENQAAAAAAAANAADVMKKAEAAEAATKKAEADAKAFQKEMSDLEAKMKKETGDEAKKTAARIAKVKAELKKNADDKKAAEDAKAAAEAALKKAGEDLAATKKNILDKYNATVKANKAKLDADTAKLDGEEKAMHAKFAKEDLDNKQKAKLAEEAVADEAAAKKAVTDAHNAAFKAAAEKKAKKVEAEYAADMAVVHRQDKIAADAEALAKKENAAAVAYQKKGDEEESNQDAYDAEMVECATDGSECMDAKTKKCLKIDDKKGPWLDTADLVHCSMKEQHVSEYSGEDWVGKSNAPDPVPREKASPECKKLVAANKAAAAVYKTHGKDFPAVELACGDNKGASGDSTNGPTKVYTDRVAALKALAAAMTECPEFCFDDTTTDTENDKGEKTTDNNGICIDKSFWAGFAEDVLDNPVYKGELCTVKGKIKAGDPGPALCTAVTDAVNEFTKVADAGNTPAPAPATALLQADPNTIAAALKAASEELKDKATKENQAAAAAAAANAA